MSTNTTLPLRAVMIALGLVAVSAAAAQDRTWELQLHPTPGAPTHCPYADMRIEHNSSTGEGSVLMRLPSGLTVSGAFTSKEGSFESQAQVSGGGVSNGNAVTISGTLRAGGMIHYRNPRPGGCSYDGQLPARMTSN